MMKKYIISITVFSLFLSFIGCSDDFLERPPESELTPEQYLFEESQLASYTINLYGILPSHGNWSFGTFGIDSDTDNMANMDYDNKYVPGQWRVGQSGGSWDFGNIRNVNYFLSTVVPRYNNDEITGSESGVKHYIGEAYFLRAFEYFNKVQSLGDFPILKKDLPDDLTVLSEASERRPHPEVVRFIISDLDSAATTNSSSLRWDYRKTLISLVLGSVVVSWHVCSYGSCLKTKRSF